jgi:hypothetical protein
MKNWSRLSSLKKKRTCSIAPFFLPSNLFLTYLRIDNKVAYSQLSKFDGFFPCSSVILSQYLGLNRFILHLIAITSLDKEQLRGEIATVIQLQGQEDYTRIYDQDRKLHDSPYPSDLSFKNGTPQSPLVSEEEKEDLQEIPSFLVQDGDLNSTSLTDTLSISRDHERKLVDVNSITWSLASSSASWSARSGHASVALDSKTIVVMGGYSGSSK